MRTDKLNSELISLDFLDLENADHVSKVDDLSSCTKFAQWWVSSVALCLLILDRTNWRTDIHTALLIPFIFFNLPSSLFNIFRGEVGKWIALVAVVLRLFFPIHFPDWLGIPGALIILIVVAPSLFAITLRRNRRGLRIGVVIAYYLLVDIMWAFLDK